MGICAGVVGTAFGWLDALGLQLAEVKRATSSRE
jgi:hypothetical protein